MSALIEGRRLICTLAKSNKFWEWRLYEVIGESRPGLQYRLSFRWGRIGTSGGQLDEFFDDKGLAVWKARKREQEKLARGYVAAYSQPTSFDSEVRATRLDARTGVKRPPKPSPNPSQHRVATLTTARRLRLTDDD